MTPAKKSKPVQKKTAAPKPEAAQVPLWKDPQFYPWSLVLFLLGFLLYANTLGHEYALDDAIVIYDNEFTTQGVEGMGGILKYDTFRGFFKVEGKEQLVSGGRYRPLSLLLFALEVELFGLNPFVGHLVNALLYGLLVVLIYKLVLLFFKNEKAGKGQWIALATALLFAVHPVHTEVVANIKGLDEILTLMGGLGAIYLSLKAFDRKKPVWHLLAGAVFLLGLLAKENAITLVAVVPLVFYFFRGMSLPRTAIPTLPFLVSAGIFLAIRFSVLGPGLGEPSMELMNNPFIKLVDGRWVPFSPGEKFATVFYTLGKYIQLLVFPHPLTHDYYPRQIPIMTFANPWALLSLLFYLGLAAYAVWGLIRRKALSLGVWFFLITLSIVSNIVFPIGTTMGERFIFMPSLGFCLFVAMGIYQLGPNWRRNLSWAGALVLLLFAMKTLSRNPVWKDNYTLFTTDVKTSPNSAKLQNSAGGETIAYAIQLQGEAARNAQLMKAVEHLNQAIRIHPTYKNAYLLLGNAHNYLQRYDQALIYYDQALQLDPNYAEAIRNRAVTLRDAGKYAGEKENNPAKAVNYLLQALQALPNDYETLRLLGVAYGVQGKNEEAIRYFSQAAQVEPENADAWFNLAVACYNANRMEEFGQYRQKALSIDPDILQKRTNPQ